MVEAQSKDLEESETIEDEKLQSFEEVKQAIITADDAKAEKSDTERKPAVVKRLLKVFEQEVQEMKNETNEGEVVRRLSILGIRRKIVALEFKEEQHQKDAITAERQLEEARKKAELEGEEEAKLRKSFVFFCR
mmetsp:Transcript_29421/g.57575  ORF Transcript_29421/g.57575 Transcript_29421/m.57575 type:complete len:134 (+) Transcript_29421:157-558(+)